ncbi:MAG TPA: hypothetical protein PLA71_00300 [Saccharofermentans sp.]|nr:hypothetical protein [Saccharofermentans sp.]
MANSWYSKRYSDLKARHDSCRELYDLHCTDIDDCPLCGNEYPYFGLSRESTEQNMVEIGCSNCGIVLRQDTDDYVEKYLKEGDEYSEKEAILFLIYKWNHQGESPRSEQSI